MITHADLGADENKARLVLVLARGVAPGLQDLEGDERENAIAILSGVAANMPDAGERRLRSLSRNGTSASMDAITSAFSPDDITALRVLCPPVSPGAGPLGHFPEGGIVDKVWGRERGRTW